MVGLRMASPGAHGRIARTTYLGRPWLTVLKGGGGGDGRERCVVVVVVVAV